MYNNNIYTRVTVAMLLQQMSSYTYDMVMCACTQHVEEGTAVATFTWYSSVLHVHMCSTCSTFIERIKKPTVLWITCNPSVYYIKFLGVIAANR
jgi:hypothetical protein